MPNSTSNAKDRLNPREELFCIEYLVDCNGTQAAIRAGYPKPGAHVTASRLLKRPKIQDELNRRRQRIETRIEITAADISREAWEIARTAKSESARVAALSLLAKRHREFSEKQELSGKDGGPIVVQRPTPEL